MSNDIVKKIWANKTVKIVVVLVIILLIASAITNRNSNDTPKTGPTEDVEIEPGVRGPGEFRELSIENSSVMELDGFDYEAKLFDVTDGEVIRKVTTQGNALGAVQARYVNGTYQLRATFVNLPRPDGTDFYEGWVVRKGENMSVVSTGALANINGEWVNVFESDTDLTDHLTYIVTNEPNDGDPAPYDSHVLEGTMVRVDE